MLRLTGTRGSVAAAPRARTVLTLPPPLLQNPYQRLLYRELVARGFRVRSGPKLRAGWLLRRRSEVGILHFHWPQAYYRFDRGPLVLSAALSWTRLGLFTVRLLAARALGYRVVWTVHQVLPHETRPELGDAAAAHLLGRASHRLICHDLHTRDSIARNLGSACLRKTQVIPHGSYVGVYPEGRARPEVRSDLGIAEAAFTFLCFGELRSYKGVDGLLRAMGQLRRPDVALIVAGAPRDDAAARAVREAAAADRRITPRLEFVPEDEVSDLFGAADVAVLPRGDGGSSGALILALSFGLPVVCADCRSYRALTGDGAAAWYFTPGDAASLARALQRASEATAQELEARRRAACESVASLGWGRVAEQTAAVLEVPR